MHMSLYDYEMMLPVDTRASSVSVYAGNCGIVSNFNTLKIPAFLVHAGLFWVFYNPLNNDVDSRVFNLRV